MADLPELDQWEAGIYQLETTDPVLGGPDGVDNQQAKQLANRTLFLKNLIAALTAMVDTKAPLANPALTGNPTAPTQAPGTNNTRLATTAFVQAALTALSTTLAGLTDTNISALADKHVLQYDNATAKWINRTLAAAGIAALASPALTGTPTAPTPAGGTNTTQLATTAFVQAAITALINSSPAALDTLNELATALGNDPNFATTITNALAGKQPLDAELTALAGIASNADRLPYFTGPGTASWTTLTEFMRGVLNKTSMTTAQKALGIIFNDAVTKTANFTITPADQGNCYVCTGNITVTLDAEAVGVDYVLVVKNSGTGTITIDATTNGDTINGVAANITLAPEEWVVLVTRAAMDWETFLSNTPLPVADTSLAGIVELATNAETAAGTDASRAVTPAGLASVLVAVLVDASTTLKGIVELATNGETNTGTDSVRAVTPAGLAYAISQKSLDRFSGRYYSGNKNIVLGGALTLAHGLGAKPELIQSKLYCAVAEAGYSVGEEVLIGNAFTTQSTGGGHSMTADNTNINVRYSNYMYNLIHATSGAPTAITPDNWRLRVYAWL